MALDVKDEKPVGGLTAASAEQDQAAPVSPMMKYATEAQTRATSNQELLNQLQNRMMALTSSRKNLPFDPTMLRLAGALLSPTKTGSFGESLGYGANALADEQEKKFLREQAEAKLQYEMQTQTMKQQEELAGQRLFTDILKASRGEPSPLAKKKEDIPAGAPVPVDKTSKGNDFLTSLNDDELFAFSGIPGGKDKVDTILKLREAARKDKIKVRVDDQEREVPTQDYENVKQMIKDQDLQGAKDWYRKYGLPFNFNEKTLPDGRVMFEPMTAADLSERKKSGEERGSLQPRAYEVPEVGKDKYELLPVEYDDYKKAKKSGADSLQKWFNDTKPEWNVKVPGAKAAEPKAEDVTADGKAVGATERKVEETKGVKRAEEEVKADVEFGNNMMKEGTGSGEKRTIAKNLQSIAKSNPNIFNVMQDASIKDAFFRTVENGVSTPWGSISINPRDIVGAIDSYIDAHPEKKLTKNDRVAYGLALQDMAKLVIQERRLSRGEGAISDKETNLFGQVGVLATDSALAIRLKAELMIERANVSEHLGDAFYQYKKKTGGSYEDFTHSTEFKQIRDQYDKRLDKIRDNNAKLLGNAPPAALDSSTLPAAARRQLAEGQTTVFQNGQEWTLENGKPKRLK